MKEKAKRKIISEYRPKAFYQDIGKLIVFSLAVFLSLNFFVGIRFITQLPEFILVVPVGFIYGFIAWRVYYLGFVDRILITPEGIAVEGWHSAFADWDTLSHFVYEVISGRATKSFYGILTTKPVTNPKSKASFEYDFTHNFVPLSHIVNFTYRMKWRRFRRELALDEFAKTPLGQDLLHYAPQLFEGVNLSDEKRKFQTDDYFLFEDVDDYSQQQSEEKRGVYHG